MFALEHVWQVSVHKKELGNSRNILGPYHLCLTDRTLSLVKMGTSEKSDTIEFSVRTNIVLVKLKNEFESMTLLR